MENMLLKNDFLKRTLRPQKSADTGNDGCRGNVHVSPEFITEGPPQNIIEHGYKSSRSQSLFQDKTWGSLLLKF